MDTIGRMLHHWAVALAPGGFNGVAVKVDTPEQAELLWLREENAKLKREVEVLKRVSQYFAKLAV